MKAKGAPEFNVERFGSWLRRWRESERLGWRELSERSGLNVSTLHGLAGHSVRRKTTVGKYDPSINTLARLGHGLGLELPYLLSKADVLEVSDEGRWRNFSHDERVALARALGTIPPQLRTPLEQTLGAELLDTVTNSNNNSSTDNLEVVS